MFKLNKIKFSTIYLVLVVLVLSLTGAICQKQEETPTPTETPTETPTPVVNDLTTIDYSTINSMVMNNYTTAKQKATTWKGDAKLYNYTVKLPIDLSINNGTETFVFGSDSDKLNWWVLSVSESTNKSLRALIPKEDYLGNTLAPINTSFWKTNYLQAFQKAEIYQGKTFREANANSEITINLSMGEPKGWLWWVVEYKAPSGNILKVRVNPSDLTVVDDLGNIVQTTQTGTTGTEGTGTTGTSGTNGTSGTGTTGTSGTGTNTTSGTSGTGTSETETTGNTSGTGVNP